MDHDFNLLGNPTPTGRLPKLKTAVTAFAANLRDTDIIGVQEFNGWPFAPTDATDGDATHVIQSFDNWASVKTSFAGKINALQAMGSTHTRHGFVRALQEITQARSAYPGYKWVMIFISDGAPKESYITRGQPWQPDQSQDPRIPPNIATQIKDLGVEIFSIGIDLNSQPYGNDAYAKQLMREVASKPEDTFENATADQLSSIYANLADSICR